MQHLNWLWSWQARGRPLNQPTTRPGSLSILTCQRLAKLQEPIVSFNLASLSQKRILNTTRNLLHWEHVGQLALLVFSLKDARGYYWWFHQRMPGGNKGHQPLALYRFVIDVHFLESLQHDKLLDHFQHLDQLILYFRRFWIDPLNNTTNLNLGPREK